MDWVGWGGVLTRMLRYCTLACSSTDASCYLSTSSYEHIFIWIGWGGVGWGNNVICFAFSHGRALLCSCNSMDASCYLSTFSYDMGGVGWGKRDSEEVHNPKIVVLRVCTFSCTLTAMHRSPSSLLDVLISTLQVVA